jgi:hypothetical protein
MIAPAQTALDEIEQLRRRPEIRKSLRQVDGAMLLCELRHQREYRRADVGKLAVEAPHA